MQPRHLSKAIYWSVIVASGILGWRFGDDFTIRISMLAPSYFRYWSLSLLAGQLLTATISFLLLYRGLVFGLVARRVARRGVAINAESTVAGILLSAFLPLLIWAIGITLMMDLARSGMHDSM
jgi:hypothetical protein